MFGKVVLIVVVLLHVYRIAKRHARTPSFPGSLEDSKEHGV